MRVIHIITSLQDGGAEHTLYKICKYDKRNEHIVISLTGTGKYLSLLNKLGIKVYCLNLKFYLPMISFLMSCFHYLFVKFQLNGMEKLIHLK